MSALSLALCCSGQAVLRPGWHFLAPPHALFLHTLNFHLWYEKSLDKRLNKGNCFCVRHGDEQLLPVVIFRAVPKETTNP